MNNYLDVLRDSVETSVHMKIFKNFKDSCFAHIYKSELKIISMKIFKNVDNFNPNRLQKSAIKAYPLNDRPRGDKNISSLKYLQKELKNRKEITPIWMIKKNNKYILLDGAHRIVAHYIEDKKNIKAFVITI